MLLRLLALVVLASVLTLGAGSESPVAAEPCAVGAISAIGPVDAEGNGDTIPDVACIEP
jgi:hypothetical protein